MNVLKIVTTLFVLLSIVGIVSAYTPVWTANTAWNVPDVGLHVVPAFADLDGDGDYDLLIGESDGVSFAYENTGTASNPTWTANTAWNGPYVGEDAVPAFADLDGDGDYDLLIGENGGDSFAYENTGTASNPTWTANTAWNGPDVGMLAAPAFADLDGDGDYDLLIGEDGGDSFAYENTGTASNPIWTANTAWNGPDVGKFAALAFADLDGDGDYDLLIGEFAGGSLAYENTGTASNPTWTANIAWNGPDVGMLAAPAFADLDGDGDYDLLIGEFAGGSFAYEYTAVLPTPTSNDIPEFPTVALPVISIIGLMFLFQKRKGK